MTAPPIAAIQQNVTSDGTEIRAKGAVDYYDGDFYSIKFMPNRYMPNHLVQAAEGDEALETTATGTRLYIVNPKTWKVCYLDRIHRDRMGTRGDFVETTIRVDWGLKSYYERANAVISDIDYTLDVAA